MPLESCIICLDLSEFMRNGDYAPTRLDAQYDAACLLGGGKLQQNPESTVGVLASGGKGVNILASPTNDLGKLLASLHGLTASGSSSLQTAVKTAQLALKHRKNRNGSQRIVCVVGSPVEEDERELKRLGAVLKKSSIALDIIAVGENEGNAAKLQAFVEAADSGANSRLLLVPAGVLPSDVLAGHAILLGDEAAVAAAAGAGVGGGGGGGFHEYGGVDPAMDPELAMALRVSMEEARASARDDTAPPATAAGGSAAAAAPSAAGNAMDVSDEDLLLQQALALSAAEDSAPAPTAVATTSSATSATGVGASSSASTPQAAGDAALAPTESAASTSTTSAFSNPDFVQSLLGDLPGVDMNDPALREAMRVLAGGLPLPSPAPAASAPGGSGGAGAPPPPQPPPQPPAT